MCAASWRRRMSSSKKVSANGIFWRAYRQTYRGEPFVRIVKEKTGIYRYPEPKILSGTNYADVGFRVGRTHGAGGYPVRNRQSGQGRGRQCFAEPESDVRLGRDDRLGLCRACIRFERCRKSSLRDGSIRYFQIWNIRAIIEYLCCAESSAIPLNRSCDAPTESRSSPKAGEKMASSGLEQHGKAALNVNSMKERFSLAFIEAIASHTGYHIVGAKIGSRQRGRNLDGGLRKPPTD